ncbi:MAG: FtsW/RodA/SpoVE family cell cycle protein [Verrucomicrobia bacterium]|nr:FtsW/RodA/SpoVE family cell cycle protein [Verrucomicrobiota bacterium]
MPRLATFLICASVALLVAMGMVMLASTSYWVSGVEQPHFLINRQTGVLIVSLVCCCVLVFLKPDRLRSLAPWVYGLGVVLLALCYAPYVGVKINGASRWLDFPGLPRFQASEIGKITTMVGIAAWYAGRVSELRTFWKGFVIPGAILGLPTMLIFFEKDMDTAMAVGLTGILVLVCIGVKLRYITPVVVAVIAVGYVVIIKDDTRRQRIEAWQHLEENLKEYQDINRQQWRSLLGFGNGGVEGRGLGNGIEKHGYLPEAHTDFIFPVIGEELGLWFTLGVVICYIAFGIGGFIIAMNAPDMFMRTMAVGLTMLLLIPAFINIAVTVGLFPNAGLPLPFISYGGTNLMFSLWSVALLIGINRESVKCERLTTPEFMHTPVPMKL